MPIGKNAPVRKPTSADIIPVNVLYRLTLFVNMAAIKNMLVAENVFAIIKPAISILLRILSHSPPFITINPSAMNRQSIFITMPTRNGANQ